MKKSNLGKNKERPSALEKLYSPQGLLLWGFLIVVLPLVYVKKALDPSLMPQLLAVSVFLFIYYIISNLTKERIFLGRKIFSDPFLIFVLLYLLITIASMFSSINPKESLFDISKTFIFIVVIILTFHQLEKETRWMTLIPNLFLLTTSVMVIIGFYQYYTLVILRPEKILPDGRAAIYAVDGLMAHKNLYASSLFLMLPLLIWGFINSQKLLKIAFATVSAGTLAMLILLSTRAVWLGLIIATFSIVLILLAWGKRFDITKKIRILLLVSSISLFVGMFAIVALAPSGSYFSIAERFKSIFDPKKSENKYRIYVWEVSLKIAKENPILGVGAGNWKLNDLPYYHQYKLAKDQLNWIRPHNDFLWVLSEKGVPGFLAYLAFFFLAFFYLFKTIGYSSNIKHKVIALLLIGGITGYLTISFFDFPLERIYHQIILAIWLSVAIYLRKCTNDKPEESSSRIWLPMGILLGLCFVIFYSYTTTKLELIVKKTREAQFRGNWAEMLDYAKNIPTRFRTMDAEAMPIHYYHGLANENLGHYEIAKDFYHVALLEHPTKIQVMNNLGLMYFNLIDYPNAKKYFEMALSILPDYFEALVNLSAVYGKEDNAQKSLEYLNKVPKKNRDDRFFKRQKYLQDIIQAEGK